jgi:4-hydroxybenzoate decarboxylase subunit C
MASAPASTRAFVELLAQRGELVTVEAPVSADLELAEIHRRVIAANGPALLFCNVVGHSTPVVTNLFGSAQRVLWAFGERPRRLIEQVAALPHELLPPSPSRLWRQRGLFADLLRVGQKHLRRAPANQRNEQPPALRRLPALRTWARDGGPFVTLPLVLTRHPETGVPNLGMYRIQIFDDQHTGLHMQIGKGGGFHLKRAEELGLALPVNVHVGGPPAAILAAIAPLPENVPELLLASLVLGQRLPLAHNPAGPLPLLAEADFTLVGEVKPGDRHPEGPFGDHYGYYSEIHDYPRLTVEALLSRKDAIFPATVVGKPRQEDFYIGDFLQDMLSPLFPVVMPAVKALWSYGETGYHALSAARVEERYKREAMASAFRILGEGQLALTKFLLLTDGQVDLKDFRATLVHILERTDLRTDLFLLPNLSMDSLDYAGPTINAGSKGVLLGIGPKRRDLPISFSGSPPPTVRRVEVYCPGVLTIEGPGYAADPEAAASIARHPAFAEWSLLVLTDDARRAARSDQNFLWTTFTRFDPARDIAAAKSELLHHHASLTPPLAIDARMKPWYPEELFCDPKTKALVSQRWNEYFPGRNVPMGDSDQGHLD